MSSIAVLAAGIADEALQHLAQAVAPGVVVSFGDIDADDGEVFGQQAGVRQVVERRHQQPMVRSPPAPKMTMAHGPAVSAVAVAAPGS